MHLLEHHEISGSRVFPGIELQGIARIQAWCFLGMFWWEFENHMVQLTVQFRANVVDSTQNAAILLHSCVPF
jgi:hypothetical protein